FFMKDGSLAALGRQLIKDTGDTFHEVAWGNSGHGREPGGPLMPLYMDIADARDQYQQENATMPPASPSQIAKENGPLSTVHGQAREAGPSPQPSPSQIAKDQATVHGPADGGRDDKSWAGRIDQRAAGDQDGAHEAQIAEHQKEQEHSRGR